MSLNSNETGPRVVFFGKRGGVKNGENPSAETIPNPEAERFGIKWISQADYLKDQARQRGLIEKNGYLVDPVTRKVDRGQVCEEALLGRYRVGRNEKIPVPINKDMRTYAKARNFIIDFVKDHQPMESAKKEENISGQLESIIRSRLTDERLSFSAVNFYTAVGSPLDYQYGVDGWVEIIDLDGKKEIITFDLKTGSYANPNIQADILLRLDLKEDGFTPKQTITELFKFTDEVTRIYQERINF